MNVVAILGKGDDYTAKETAEIKNRMREKGREYEVNWYDLEGC